MLTGEKWGVGPTAVVLKQFSGFTVGALGNQIWSVAGDNSRADISQSFIQPFISYTTPDAWTFGLNTESTYNWEAEEWTVPVNALAALTATSLVSIADKAEATPQCSSHDKIVNVLADKYKETRRVMGMVNSTAVMEIFMSPQGTWTILITDTSGLSRITASGEEWQEVPVAVAGLDS